MARSFYLPNRRAVAVSALSAITLLTTSTVAIGSVPQLFALTGLLPITYWVTASAGVCDFDNDGNCDADDLNALFAQGDLTLGVLVSGSNPYDLDGSSTLGQSDIDLWLADAAGFNGYSTPYRRGDTDGLGAIHPEVIDVDLTDFSTLAANFGPGLKTWEQGNFDGDNDVDLTDFGFLAANFADSGYGLPIPEPATVQMSILGLAGVGWLLRRRRTR